MALKGQNSSEVGADCIGAAFVLLSGLLFWEHINGLGGRGVAATWRTCPQDTKMQHNNES